MQMTIKPQSMKTNVNKSQILGEDFTTKQSRNRKLGKINRGGMRNQKRAQWQ